MKVLIPNSNSNLRSTSSIALAISLDAMIFHPDWRELRLFARSKACRDALYDEIKSAIVEEGRGVSIFLTQTDDTVHS